MLGRHWQSVIPAFSDKQILPRVISQNKKPNNYNNLENKQGLHTVNKRYRGFRGRIGSRTAALGIRRLPPLWLCTMGLYCRTINTLRMKWTVADRKKKYQEEMQLLCCIDLERLTWEFTSSATSALQTTARRREATEQIWKCRFRSIIRVWATALMDGNIILDLCAW